MVVELMVDLMVHFGAATLARTGPGMPCVGAGPHCHSGHTKGGLPHGAGAPQQAVTHSKVVSRTAGWCHMCAGLLEAARGLRGPPHLRIPLPVAALG